MNKQNEDTDIEEEIEEDNDLDNGTIGKLEKAKNVIAARQAKMSYNSYAEEIKQSKDNDEIEEERNVEDVIFDKINNLENKLQDLETKFGIILNDNDGTIEEEIKANKQDDKNNSTLRSQTILEDANKSQNLWRKNDK